MGIPGATEADWPLGLVQFRKAVSRREAARMLTAGQPTNGADEVLDVLDFGAGCPPEGKQRAVSRRALDRRASADVRKAQWLMAVSRWRSEQQAPLSILELGTCTGAGASCLVGAAGPRAHYVGLEGSPALAAITQDRVRSIAPDAGVHMQVGPFEQNLPHVTEGTQSFDVVFLDGHHDGAALVDQFRRLRLVLRAGGVFIVDDIRWSQDMYAAWRQMAEAGDVWALDLFRMGLIGLDGHHGNAPSAGVRRIPVRLLA